MWITHVFFNESKPRSRDLLMEEKSEYQCTRVLPNDEAKGFSQEKNVEFLMNPFVDDEIKRCTGTIRKKKKNCSLMKHSIKTTHFFHINENVFVFLRQKF
jgi:hypothetical protein